MSRKLKRAIDSGDVQGLLHLLENNPSLGVSLIRWGPWLCRCQSEPLHYLSDGPFNQIFSHGLQADMARRLLDAGAPVDGLPESGESPLHGAASLGEAGVAAVLIEFGADLEITASYPGIPVGTPLDFAVHFGMVEVIDLLVAKGAEIRSARMAAGAGSLELVGDLLESDQLIDVFRCACVCDRTEIVSFLLDQGLDVNAEVNGATGLHWAAWEAKPRMAQFLIERGADPGCKDPRHQMTPAAWARKRRADLGPRWGHDAVIELLTA